MRNFSNFFRLKKYLRLVVFFVGVFVAGVMMGGGVANAYSWNYFNVTPKTTSVDDVVGATNTTWVFTASASPSFPPYSLYHLIFPDFSNYGAGVVSTTFDLSSAYVVSSTYPINSSFGASINGLYNSSFEDDSSYWSTMGAHATTTQHYDGNRSYWLNSDSYDRVYYAADLESSYLYVATSTTYTVSYYAKGSGAMGLCLQGYTTDYHNVTYNFSTKSWEASDGCIPYVNEAGNYVTTTAVGSDFVRIINTVVTASDTMHVNPYFSPVSGQIFLDAVQFELGDTATAYHRVEDISPVAGLGYNVANSNLLYGYVTSTIPSTTPFSMTVSGISNPQSDYNGGLDGAWRLDPVPYTEASLLDIDPWSTNFDNRWTYSYSGNVHLYTRDTTFASVGGQVLSSVDDSPVSGVLVSLNNPWKVVTTTTDVDGNYYFDAMPANANITTGFTLTKSGWGRITTSSYGFVSSTLNTFNFTMSPAGTISGRVSFSDGPITGQASVWLYRDGSYYSGTSTNASGDYYFTDLAPGEYRVNVSAYSNHYGYGVSSTVYANTTNTVDFTMLPYKYASVEGVLVDGLTGLPPDVDWTGSTDKVRVCRAGEGCSSVNYSSDGHYYLSNFVLPLTGVSWVAVHTYWSPSWEYSDWYEGARSADYTFTEGVTTTVADLVVQPLGGMTFRTTDSVTGDPLNDVYITRRIGSSTSTDVVRVYSNGEVSDTGVPTSTWSFDVRKNGYVSVLLENQSVVFGTTTIFNISMLPLSAISYFSVTSSDAIGGRANSTWVFQATTTAALSSGDVVSFVFPSSSEFSSQFNLDNAGQSALSGSISFYESLYGTSRNLHHNSGFEADELGASSPAGWSVMGFGGGEPVDASSTITSVAYAGDKGLFLETGSATQGIGVVPNYNDNFDSSNIRAYTTSVYAKGVTNTGEEGQVVLIIIGPENTVWNFTASVWEALNMENFNNYIKSFTVNSSTWQRFSYTVPNSDLYPERIIEPVWGTMSPNQNIVLDNIQLEPSKNLLMNGNFERLGTSTLFGWGVGGPGGMPLEDATVASTTDGYPSGGNSAIQFNSGTASTIVALYTDSDYLNGNILPNTQYTASIRGKMIGSTPVDAVTFIYDDNECWNATGQSWDVMEGGMPGAGCMLTTRLSDNNWALMSTTFSTDADPSHVGVGWMLNTANASLIFDEAQLVKGSSRVADGPTVYSESSAVSGLMGTTDSTGTKIVYGYVNTTTPASTTFTLSINGITNANAEATSTLENLRWNMIAGTPVFGVDMDRWYGIATEKMNVSSTASMVPGVSISVPAGTSTVSISNVSTSSLIVRWSAVADATGYYLYENSSLVTTTVATGTVRTGLTPSTSYSYYVVAFNDGGSGGSSSNVATTTLPTSGGGTVSISGTVLYYDGVKTVGTARVSLYNGSGELLQTVTTTSSGEYQFTGLTSGANYTVSSTKNDNLADPDVDVFDLVSIRRHITEIAIFNSVFKEIAADVNDDVVVSVYDLIKIRRYIAQSDPVLTSGGWKFYSSDAVSGGLTFSNHLTTGLNRTYTNLSTNQTAQDFTGVKMGDVNNSWTNI